MSTFERLITNIRGIIRERGLSYDYVAKKAGLGKKQFSALLAGREVFRTEYTLAIANALGLTTNDLLQKDWGAGE